MASSYTAILDKIMNISENPILNSMFEELSRAPEIYHPDNLWMRYVEQNLQQLHEQGLQNFKRTVNHNYFNWIKERSKEQCGNILPQLNWLSKLHSSWSAFSKSSPLLPPADWSGIEWSDYVHFLCNLWEFTDAHDHLKILRQLNEPLLGNPYAVQHRGFVISQDICNSVLEINSMAEGFGGKLPAHLRIGELGAGYGRDAYVFLKCLPEAKVTIIDIPPTLYVAQSYLSNIFTERKIFTFRQFSNYKDIQKELEESSIAFLLPHQVELLPDNMFDLFINISSFYEMTMPQIDNWFNNIDRLCNGFLYSKQMLHKVNQWDGLEVKQSDYPIRQHWQKIFERQCAVQKAFFEGLYKLRS